MNEQEEQEKIVSASMADFDTTTNSTEGVEIELMLPDGTKTDKTITIRGADAVEYRKAQARISRIHVDRMRKNKGKDIDAGVLHIQQIKEQRELTARLVCDWNFDEECTHENVCKFFESAPAIQEQVDSFAGDRENFFNKPSEN